MQITISGMFFQDNLFPELGFGSEGLALYLKRARLQTMFAGLIHEDPKRDSEKPPILVGSMMDHYGRSSLTEVVYDNEKPELRFWKQYENRSDVIEYSFSRLESGIWIGQYSGAMTGSGVTWCSTTEIGDEFFNPERLAEILDRQVFEMPK